MHPPRDPQSEDLVIAAAPGVGPLASNASSGEPAEDSIGGAAPGLPVVMARSGIISVGLTAWTVALTPLWAPAADPLASESDVESLPAASGPANGLTVGSVAFAMANLPAPRGADLITDLAAFRPAQVEECVTRLFERFEATDQPAVATAHWYPRLIGATLAVVALELARRWRRPPAKALRKSRRPRFS